jgi:hypothetical protein
VAMAKRTFTFPALKLLSALVRGGDSFCREWRIRQLKNLPPNGVFNLLSRCSCEGFKNLGLHPGHTNTRRRIETTIQSFDGLLGFKKMDEVFVSRLL